MKPSERLGDLETWRQGGIAVSAITESSLEYLKKEKIDGQDGVENMIYEVLSWK